MIILYHSQNRCKANKRWFHANLTLDSQAEKTVLLKVKRLAFRDFLPIPSQSHPLERSKEFNDDLEQPKTDPKDESSECG